MRHLAAWIPLLAINAAAAVAFAAVTALTTDTGWRQALTRTAGVSFIISTTISSLAGLVLGRVTPILVRRTGTFLRWAAIIVVLVAVAVAGNALAMTALVAVGYVPARWDAFRGAYLDTIDVSIVVTLVCGIFITFNEMLRSRLVEATTASQLASLEARVNPHFFFNTLNSIAALTREDPAGAERMTTQLASLMRSSLGQESTPLVPLAHEIQVVRDYLEIERVRFGARLRVEERIEPGLEHVAVPTLLLQPVVENAVRHGVAARPEGGRVVIEVRREGSRLVLTVADDGPGFDPGGPGAPGGNGFGLHSVRERLRAAGLPDALALDTAPGRGARVVVTLPLDGANPPT